MKKIILIKLFLLLVFTANAQISVSSSHVGSTKKIDKEDLERFKKTETIFLLSNVIDKAVYEDILKKNWTVTPYKIININDFDARNYIDDKYSFVYISGTYIESFKGNYKTGYVKVGIGSDKIYTYVDIFMFDNEKKAKELARLAQKSQKTQKEYQLFEKHKIAIARFYLEPDDNFIYNLFIGKKTYEELGTSMYEDVNFYNYLPGFLKNYFQKINNVIAANEGYWMYGTDFDSEVKKLASNTLYIPDYFKLICQPMNRDKVDGPIKLLKDYKYKYEFLKDIDLDKKIQNGEEFYYVRYVRMNSERFLQIVNSKTGNIVYREYIAGMMSLGLDSGDIKNINKAIEK